MSSLFFWLRSANNVKSKEKFVMGSKKIVLEKNVYKLVKYRFAIMSQSRKDSPKNGLSLREKIPGAAFSKEGDIYIYIYMYENEHKIF